MQRLAFFLLAPILVATLGATPALPTRPADGTYVYSIPGSPGSGSTVVIRTDGATVSVIENLTASGANIASQTDYDATSLLPAHYRVAAHGTTTDITFAGPIATLLAPPMTFHANPGADLLTVGDGLIAFMAMLPSTVAAHSDRPISLLNVNGGTVVTVRATPALASRPAGIPAGDIPSAIVESTGARFDFWTNPQTHAVDAINVAGLAVRLSSRTDSTTAATPAPPAVVATPYPLPRARYVDRRVSFASSGAVLAGTLSIPKGGPRRHPAFAFVHGSGASTRDGGTPQNPTFLDLGNALANSGYAILRYDKRGVGDSTGALTESWKPLGDDARAAVAFLLTQPDIDPHRIFLLGHSEGGLIVPLITPSIKPAVAGIVLLAGQAIPISHLFDEQAPRMSDALRQVFKTAFADYNGIDPTALIQKVKCPILVLQGTRDGQILANDLPPMVAAARRAKRSITVDLLDGDNHLFMRLAPTQPEDFSEYFVPAPLDPRVAQSILKWAAAIP